MSSIPTTPDHILFFIDVLGALAFLLLVAAMCCQPPRPPPELREPLLETP